MRGYFPTHNIQHPWGGLVCYGAEEAVAIYVTSQAERARNELAFKLFFFLLFGWKYSRSMMSLDRVCVLEYAQRGVGVVAPRAKRYISNRTPPSIFVISSSLLHNNNNNH